MFLAASPYFNFRFVARPSLSRTFQSSVLTVSTITNLVVTMLLTKLQRTANYASRIKLGLAINTVAFVLLTISTTSFRDVSPDMYLAFVLVDVCLAALATGLFQNGAFAFAAGFGRREYTQAVMVGQGLAGVLPALAQMVSVLIVPPSSTRPAPGPATDDAKAQAQPPPPDTISSSAFIYFLAAVVVSIITLVSFLPLSRRYQRLVARRTDAHGGDDDDVDDDGEHQGHAATRKVVDLSTLFRKLHWEAGSVAICFVATIAFFPVFTGKILSTHGQPHSRLFDAEVFIPLGFLCWNAGDLAGRMFTGGAVNAGLRRRPVVLFLFGCVRFAFLPLYLLCNLHGGGAVVSSDLFYLVLVQLPFGLSNGWLASNAMMAATEAVDEGEREAAGGFMGLCLVAGLTVGSLLSFTVTDI